MPLRLGSFGRDIILKYVRDQKMDFLLFLALALDSGAKLTPDLAWTALEWVCQHGTPTAEAVKEALKG